MVGFKKEALDAARLSRKRNAEIRNQQKLDLYNTNPIRCGNPKCENNLEYHQFIGGRKFCCVSCSNAVVIRLSSKESKLKVSETFSKKPKNVHYCKICQKEISRRRTYCDDKECRIKSRSESAKLGRKTAKERGTLVGWSTRTKEPSYPEKYFIELLNNEKISFIRELRVGKWFIDFALIDYKIALEIDGKQHEYDDRKKSDLEKDEFLKIENWFVFRIKWFNPINEVNKEKLYSQIMKLKELLPDYLEQGWIKGRIIS